MIAKKLVNFGAFLILSGIVGFLLYEYHEPMYAFLQNGSFMTLDRPL